MAYGQSRVLLIWIRLVMPDGSSIVLDNLPAADTQGYAGSRTAWTTIPGACCAGLPYSTLLGVSSELATNGNEQTSGSGNIIVALRQSGDSSANQAGQSMVSKDLAVSRR
jgi:Type IV secretory pathway, VirB10 components